MSAIAKRLGYLAVLASVVFSQSGRAQQPDETWGGLRDVMLRAFSDWRTAHESFDSTFSAQMKALLNIRPEDIGGSDLCRQDQPSSIRAVTTALTAQLDAQQRYYKHNRDDAEKALNDQDFLMARIKSEEKQRQEDLKVAADELKFLVDQRDQLRGAGASISREPINGNAGSRGSNGAVGKLVVRGNAAFQAAPLGGGFSNPLAVIVTDGSGNPISDARVTYKVQSASNGASATLGTAVPTSSDGTTNVAARANMIAGDYTVTASVGGLTAAFVLTNLNHNPGAIVPTSGAGQSATVGAVFEYPLVVSLKDGAGKALGAGVVVRFESRSATGASATFPGGSMVTTDAQGQASVRVAANDNSGQYSVIATAPEVAANVSFTLTNTPNKSDKANNLEQALKEMDSTIQLRQEKVDTLKRMQMPLGDTLVSIEKARKNYEARLKECDDSLGLIEVQRRYWRAVYEMRSTQVVEYCGQTPLQRPLILK